MSEATLSPYGPDSDLLFAALAHQLGFVRREDLLTSLELWAEDRHRPLSDILVERRAIAAHRRRLLDDVVQEYLLQHGMDAARALETVCSGRQETLDLGRFTSSSTEGTRDSGLLTMHTLTPNAPSGTAAYLTEGPPSGVGTRTIPGWRFRILRPHAQGALGQVYLAQDEELNRQVALKEIQEAYAGHRDCRARFLLEAEITGSLEHPGIVPVYALGMYADGRPYYAMRFIRGESFHEAITRFHAADDDPHRDPGDRAMTLRGMLGRFVDVCNAIAYAHSRGVLHRDIKPGNIMLGPYGETLVVDWGMAKALGGEAPGGTEEPIRPMAAGGQATMLGQAIGTPSFMSPEAAAGKVDQVGPASDIYSLGATLFALLTGVPPFDGDRVSTILAMAERNDFQPPRRVKRSVPAALEAVVLRAMAAEQGDRYPSAAELAQDVERWLADEPVRAYREPILDRARRWMRRHRPLVTGVAALLLSALVGLGVGLWAVNREKDRTALERDTAEHNFRLARRAVDECFLLATEDPLLQQEKMRGVRRLLLQKALPFYEGFQTRKPDSADIASEIGNNHFRVARITSEIGRKSVAITSYEQARTVFVDLVQKYPDDENYRLDLARVHNDLGLLLRDTGRGEEELAELTAALELRERLASRNPNIPEYQSDLAATYNNLGVSQRDRNRPKEAEKHFDLARDTLRQLLREHKGDIRYRAALAAALHNLGQLHAEQGAPDRSLAEYREARSLREGLHDKHQEVAAYRNDLAGTLIDIAVLVRDTDRAEALRCGEKAQTLSAALEKEFPEVAEYRFGLARALDVLGVLKRKVDPKDAQALHAAAIRLLVKLVEQHPDEAEYSMALVRANLNLGRLHLEGSRPEDALPCFDQIAACINRLSMTEQAKPHARQLRRDAALGRAETLGKLRRHAEALPSWDEAVRLSDPPDHDIEVNRAKAYARAGRHAEAVAQAEALLAPKVVRGEMLYETACVFALAAKAAHSDAKKPENWRQRESSRLASRAVGLLERARENRFFDSARMRDHVLKDDDFAFLIDRDDFRAFLRRIEAMKD